MNLSFLNDKTPLEAALFYAKELRWSVFPLHSMLESGEAGQLACTCGVKNCTRAAKHPILSEGFYKATIVEEQIIAWWTKWPKANIGIRLGDDLALIDVDTHGQINGLENLPQVFDADPALKDTLQAKSGGNGLHFFIKVGEELSTTNKTPWPGIEVRCKNSYVVASPSVHASGKKYQWESGTHLVEPNEELLSKLRTGVSAPAASPKIRNEIIGEGSRNIEMWSLATSCCATGMSQEDALEFVKGKNHKLCAVPLDEEEIEGIVRRAYTYNPSWSHNELGNARAMSHWFGQDLRWTPHLDWIEWKGDYWRQTPEVKIRQKAHIVTDMLKRIAQKENNDQLYTHANRSQNHRPISGMLGELKAIPGIAMEKEDFPPHPFWLPCLNGTYELDKGIFRPSQREDYSLRRIPVSYDPSAECPKWRAALELWMGGDTKMVKFLQRLVGYCLTEDVRHQALFILYGDGDNGKSTFTLTLHSLLGPYSSTMHKDVLMQNNRVNKEYHVADLYQKRLVLTSESGIKERFDMELVKQMTGGEPLTGRYPYGKVFYFTPTHKIIFSTNHKPTVSSAEWATWRRLKLIPFTVRIPADKKDPNFVWELQKELPGILNWAIEGNKLWKEIEDLAYPEQITQAVEEYRHAEDRIAQFIEDALVHEKGASVSGAEMSSAGKRWFAESGYQSYGRNRLFEELEKHGVLRTNAHGSTVWKDVKIRDQGRSISLG